MIFIIILNMAFASSQSDRVGCEGKCNCGTFSTISCMVTGDNIFLWKLSKTPEVRSSPISISQLHTLYQCNPFQHKNGGSKCWVRRNQRPFQMSDVGPTWWACAAHECSTWGPRHPWMVLKTYTVVTLQGIYILSSLPTSSCTLMFTQPSA